MKYFSWEIFQKIFASNPEKRQFYLEVVAPKLGDRMLDIGCNNGLMSSIFLDCNYTGVDIDPEASKYAKRRYRSFSNMEFLPGDVCGISLDGNYDHILIACVGHHLDDKNIYRIMERASQIINKREGIVHFVDMLYRKDYPLRTRMVLWMERGRHIRTLEEHDMLFKGLS